VQQTRRENYADSVLIHCAALRLTFDFLTSKIGTRCWFVYGKPSFIFCAFLLLT